GEQFQVSYTSDGQSIVLHVGRNAAVPSLAGNVAQSSYQGVTTPYAITNGKVVTTLSQAPMEVVVYKKGDAYYAARSNEFGYASYEILPKPPTFLRPWARVNREAAGPIPTPRRSRNRPALGSELPARVTLKRAGGARGATLRLS